MDLERLLRDLARPHAYPHRVDAVEVHQTHISAVFLAGDFAYKVKKPVDLGFLDYSTPARRRELCEEEVRLNRRLAPDVYLGVVPLVEVGGALLVEARGEAVEHAVKMRRLPEGGSFRDLLTRGALEPAHLAGLARQLATFYAGAPGGEAVAAGGSREVVAGNCRENFEQLAPFVGDTLTAPLLEALANRTEELLAEHAPLLEARASRGVPRDAHGDLRLEHVYLPAGGGDGPLRIVDCIEFNERFRHADPVADVAFLSMELDAYGRPDLRAAFEEAFLAAAADAEGAALLPFYVAYRHVVRGKVRSLESAEEEIPAPDRAAARRKARRHFLAALGELRGPGAGPVMVLCGGLPGSGKSTLARLLAEELGAPRISSDVVRKELAGLAATEPGDDGLEQGIYTREFSERTYAECLLRAERELERGGRVVVDGTMGLAGRRARFLNAARELGVPAVYIVCRVDEEVVRARIAAREGDESDADFRVYELLRDSWEPFDSLAEGARFLPLDTAPPPEEVLARALAGLRDAGLA